MTITFIAAAAALIASGGANAAAGETLTARASETVVAPAPKGHGLMVAPGTVAPGTRTTAPTCAARIVRPDSSVDAAMAVPAPPHLDNRMAVRGRCAAPTAARP